MNSPLAPSVRENNIFTVKPGEAEHPLVSIIIPCFNHADFVGDAIQSVLNQDYQNYEIIVIDDGSTDNSSQVVGKFGNKVQYIWQKNQGLSAARNTGIRIAKGNLIGLLDSDDLYEPGFLSTMVSNLEKDPLADGIYCGFQFVDEHNLSLSQKEIHDFPPDTLFETLLGGNRFVPEALIVRRRCYQEIEPFDETLRACEDWDIWLQISKKFRIIGIPQVLIRYRVTPGSMSSDPIRMLNNRLVVIDKQFPSESDDISKWSNLHHMSYGKAYLTTAVEYLQTSNLKAAYDCFIQMAVIFPESLLDAETYYELGCGNQLKGSRGDFSSLDIAYNASVLLQFLNSLFLEPKMLHEIISNKKQILAEAYLVLGILANKSQEYSKARNYLWKSLMEDLRNGVKKEFIFTFVKSILGIRSFREFRRARAIE